MKRVALTLLACVALTLLATTASAQGYSRRHAHSGYGLYLGETHPQAVARITARRPRGHYRTHPRSMYNAPPCYQGYGYTTRGPTDFLYAPSQHGYRAYGH